MKTQNVSGSYVVIPLEALVDFDRRLMIPDGTLLRLMQERYPSLINLKLSLGGRLTGTIVTSSESVLRAYSLVLGLPSLSPHTLSRRPATARRSRSDSTP